MKNLSVRAAPAVALACLLFPGIAPAQSADHDGTDATPVSKEEITRQVPALNDLHEVVYQLWHEAYPAKDCQMIKDLLPKADEMTAKLDAAALPGILRDSQAQWDEGKVVLKESLAALHAAADANDDAQILARTEAYHSAFETLVRVVRPVVPELDAFHQDLYLLYHYHLPDFDVAAIRADAAAMQGKIAPLKAAKLPERLAGKQTEFDKSVNTLSGAVDDLVAIAKQDDKDGVRAAVEAVHTAYVKTVKVFE